VTGEQHHDTSRAWLYFFFICFGIVLLGIVIFFARPVSDQSQQAPSTGGHSMILPSQSDFGGVKRLTA
jgi:uncharacterized membrane protein